MMTIVTVLNVSLLLAILFLKWRREGALKKIFWPAVLFKMAAGVSVGLVYTYYYQVGDTFAYFRDGCKLALLAREDIGAYARVLFADVDVSSLPLELREPRAFFLTRITSIFNIITYNNYWVTGLYYSLLSFLGAWYLVKVIVRNIPVCRVSAVVAFLFLPSVIFWTAGLLKESLAMASMYFLSALFLRIWFNERPSPGYYVIAALCLWIFWSLKYYYAAVFLPIVITTLAYKFFVRKRVTTRPVAGALLWLAILVLPAVLVTFIHPNFAPDRLLHVVIENNSAYNQLSAPGKAVRFDDLMPTPVSFLQNSPVALISGLFRPFIWETTGPMQLLAGMENTIVFVAFLFALRNIRSFVSSPHRVLLLAVTVYVVLLSALITLSAPNFGTLSRYKVGYLSFFILVILSGNPLMLSVERSIRRLVSN